MRFHTALIALAATAAIAPATASAQSAPCVGADAIPTAATAAQAGAATVCLVNQERTKAGLPALRQQKVLSNVARRYAATMAAQDFFDHVGRNGSTLSSRVSATRYLKGARSWGLAENIAWGGGSLATPSAIVASWMGSAPHRANIMDASLREVGVGVSIGAPQAGVAGPAATYVHDFGRRR